MKKVSLIAILSILLGGSAFAEDVQVCILGDSMMQSVARALKKKIAKTEGMQAQAFTSIGSGLARMDLFDWHAKIAAAVAEQHPDIVVILMGANDNQPMKANGKVLDIGTEAWRKEYAARIDKSIQLMLDGGAKSIIWIGLPDMREKKLQKDVQVINTLIQTEAEKQEAVEFMETQSIFSKHPGEFSPYILADGGMPLHVRAGDGVHLNREGADMLADLVLQRISP